MIPWIIVVLGVIAGWPVVVLADAGEMSVGGELVAGFATIGDGMVSNTTDTETRLGTAIRLTYATSDWYAYELGLSWERLARYAEYSMVAERATRMRAWGWWRLDGGVVARLGVAWIPTLRAGLGLQGRNGKTAILHDVTTYHADGDPELELVASLGAGFEHRLDQTWVIGIRFDGQHSFLLGESVYRALSSAIYVAGYWYP